MASGREDRRAAYLGKVREELAFLASQGVVAGGNAFSSVLVMRAIPPEVNDPIFTALRASLDRLGYPPEDWAWLSTCSDEGTTPLNDRLLREAITVLDPATIIIADIASANTFRNAYADELSALPNIDQAMLTPGLITLLRGMRILSLGDFAAALESDKHRRVAWRWLKQLTPLGEPY